MQHFGSLSTSHCDVVLRAVRSTALQRWSPSDLFIKILFIIIHIYTSFKCAHRPDKPLDIRTYIITTGFCPYIFSYVCCTLCMDMLMCCVAVLRHIESDDSRDAHDSTRKNGLIGDIHTETCRWACHIVHRHSNLIFYLLYRNCRCL